MQKLKLFIFIVFIFIPGIIFSQIGIEFMINKNNYPDWNKTIYNYSLKESELFKYSYGAGLNYWFRLHNYRVEFTPGVFYNYSTFKYPDSDCKFQYDSHIGGVEFDINIYMFDFISQNYQRDCPTFSHKGEWFRKSFFIQVSPGILESFRKVKNSPDKIDYFNTSGKFDFGFGLDMKLVNNLIMAPVIKYGFYVGEKWKGFSEFHGEQSFNDITRGNYLTLVLNFYFK